MCQDTAPKSGDYVIYRDPDRFLSGDPNHTNYYYVASHEFSDIVLEDLRTGDRLLGDPRWMRVVNPADCIADIDTGVGAGEQKQPTIPHLPPQQAPALGSASPRSLSA